MSTAVVTIDNNGIALNYHTVAICSDLPKVNQYYSNESSKDLPPIDYWIKKVNKDSNIGHYKLQHIIATGPRK